MSPPLLHTLVLGLLSLSDPPDPHEDEFAPPRAVTQVTGAGQLRLLAGAGLVHPLPPELCAQGTLEWMARSHIGVRVSGQAAFTQFGTAPHLVSGRVGPSLHLLPHRRVDLSLFFEGGLALVDVVRQDRGITPLAVGGAALDVALDPYWAVRAEGHLALGASLTRESNFLAPTIWLGLGYAI